MSRSEHLLYENPPLAEVIVEFRWETQRIQSLPDAWIDPHFPVFERELTSRLSTDGYRTIETLTPENVPIELVGNAVIKRFRSEPNKWPVFQIGPGVFTVNIVPPYKGWAEYRPTVMKGLDYLFGCYPLADRYLTFRQFQLRYLNAFTSRHGYTGIPSFLEDYMHIAVTVPQEIASQVADEGRVDLKGEIHLPVKGARGNIGIIGFGSGQYQKEDAFLMELTCRYNANIAEVASIMEWLDTAHEMIRSWFHSIINHRMKEKMSPKAVRSKK